MERRPREKRKDGAKSRRQGKKGKGKGTANEETNGKEKNKTGYTSTQVASEWARVMTNQVFGQERQCKKSPMNTEKAK